MLFGLINEKVSDIDLFFHLNFYKKWFLSIINDGQILSEVTECKWCRNSKNWSKNSRCKKLVCFKVSDEEMQHSKIEFLGRKICVQNVNYLLWQK